MSKIINRVDSKDAELLFKEVQRLKQPWVWVLLIAMLLFATVPNLITVANQLYFHAPTSKKPSSNTTLLLVTLTTLLFPLIPIYLIGIMKLETLIKSDGIYVRFLPIQIKYKCYLWSNITKCYIRNYNPIGEFGGWGLRGLGKNKALNVSGNMGLQLETIDGDRMLIGTNKSDEITAVLIETTHWCE